MRILILTQRWYPDTFGGSEHVASEQASRLALRGHTVTVLTEYTKEILPPVEVRGTLTIYRYGIPQQFSRMGGATRTDLEEVPKLIRTLVQTPPESPPYQGGEGRGWDIVIAHHPFPAYGFLKTGLHIPMLYMFHASTAKEVEFEGLHKYPLLTRAFVWWTGRIERQVFKSADRLAVFSEFSRQLLLGMAPGVHRKAVRIPVGIDLDNFHPQDQVNARTRLGLSQDKKIILTVRRFTPRMGISRLIAALARVAETIPDVQLLIIGEGYLKQTLVSEIQRRGLQRTVSLIGSVPLADLPLYYGAADLFVLPSEALEGLGMATLEALSCGLPVVGTPAGATVEVLRDLDPTLITQSTSSAHISEGILAYFKKSIEDRTRLATRARDIAQQKYDWDKAVDELEGVLKGLTPTKVGH